MPHFRYIAQLPSGDIARGELVADRPEAVRQSLQRDGQRLLSIEQLVDRSRISTAMTDLFHKRQLRTIRSRDLELAQQQLAVMLESGLELAPSLKELGLHSSKLTVRKLCLELASSVEQGSSFGDAIAKSKAFPLIVAQLVNVGESSGELPVTLRRSAEFMEKRREIVGSLISALAYPTFVAIAALAVAAYLVGWAIPKLSAFLFAMGRNLPPMTQSLIDIADLATKYGVLVCASSGTAIIALALLYCWPVARLIMDQTLLKTPLAGGLIRMAETQLLASSLALMLRSGMHLQDALTTSSLLHRNHFLAQRVKDSTLKLSQGNPLATALVGFEPLLTSMVAVGERTGELPKALEHVASLYSSQLDARIKQLSRLVEPAIIVVAGGIVGYVYIAFFMALMSAGGNFN